MAPANRRLTEQEKLCSRLLRLGWKQRDADGVLVDRYFRKQNLRIIVSDETLLSAFDELHDGACGTKIEWEATFGAQTPYQVVMAACVAALGGMA